MVGFGWDHSLVRVDPSMVRVCCIYLHLLYTLGCIMAYMYTHLDITCKVINDLRHRK